MLSPKKTKYRKSHKLGHGGHATQKIFLAFGSYGMKSMETCWVTARQIESARRVLSREMDRAGKMWIRIFPDAPVTIKGGEIPMGKGKGAVDHYVAKIKAGTIMFELDGLPEAEAKRAVTLAAHKLPVKCLFVKK
ncbi:50S ribosomal protein L16 [Candidatus Falkowbacteria bacterium CG10_big_fil_rev_8_21_14_0_10_37_14]|uniref:Large ribosomal subunit protein uL16 n=1 Tax=Candidatus Falkowbacteria bacterium CG10_big_fil_rev_8_21_14_0_10_37_14 TaxID=1974561 RepID=A0A2M6WU24_9BACT|nr:50S ribosomal protein L16 [Candidatus Falkowbacteria bacterium]PIT96241.1 MAG: 50S ribosomal protein L16 [Candidatus Falkowbacteria bacterium CG10_big_fil_rev_8_21_14_0_10_37_14]